MCFRGSGRSVPFGLGLQLDELPARRQELQLLHARKRWLRRLRGFEPLISSCAANSGLKTRIATATSATPDGPHVFSGRFSCESLVSHD